MQFFQQLISTFEQNANMPEAKRMEAYMKGKFTFYGIKAPIRKQLLKGAVADNEDEIKKNIETIALKSYQFPERELHYCGVEIYLKCKKKRFELSDIDTIQQLIITNSWWDTVDYIAKWILGTYLNQFPQEKNIVVTNFSNAKDMWLNRSAILFQLGYKANTDSSILFEQCLKHSHSKEFFIQKAIGWALREYGKTEPKKVIDFVNSTSLKPLSQREALKHLS